MDIFDLVYWITLLYDQPKDMTLPSKLCSGFLAPMVLSEPNPLGALHKAVSRITARRPLQVQPAFGCNNRGVAPVDFLGRVPGAGVSWVSPGAFSFATHASPRFWPLRSITCQPWKFSRARAGGKHRHRHRLPPFPLVTIKSKHFLVFFPSIVLLVSRLIPFLYILHFVCSGEPARDSAPLLTRRHTSPAAIFLGNKTILLLFCVLFDHVSSPAGHLARHRGSLGYLRIDIDRLLGRGVFTSDHRELQAGVRGRTVHRFHRHLARWRCVQHPRSHSAGGLAYHDHPGCILHIGGYRSDDAGLLLSRFHADGRGSTVTL